MAVINVLDHQTIDKIAAGEVVERPASVVKELVENAVDAGADAVTVEIKDGGTSLIRVTDNGSGIEKSQVRNAFLRHATSKITSAEDLDRLSSLGFRGEALASIAAVSMVELISKTPDDLTGIRYVIEGGTERELEEIGAPEGTTVLARNLFYNTPPRKKFLKQPQTEGSYVADLMEHLALSNPKVSFKFIINGQTRFYTTGNNELKEIIYRIYGREIAAQQLPFAWQGEGISASGFLGKPVINRANRNYEIFYINGRYIKSTLLSKAVEEGYREYLMQHKFPFCVLHFRIDTDRIDVNVHPAKMEVRIADAPAVYEAVKQAVHDALHGIEMIPEVILTDRKPKAGPPKARPSVPEPFEKRRIAGMLRPAGSEEDGRICQANRAGGAAVPPVQTSRENIPPEGRPPQKVLRAPDGQPLQNGLYTPDEQPPQSAPHVPDGQPPQNILRSPDGRPLQNVPCAPNGQPPQSVPSIPDGQPLQNILRSPDGQPLQNGLYAPDGQPLQNVLRAPEEYLAPSDRRKPGADEPLENPVQMELFGDKILSEQARAHFELIGQIFGTYWLISYQDKLLIIDQHAAHEKIKYERFMKRFREHSIVSQTLNPPIVVTLSGKERECYIRHAGDFEALGFVIEEFGGNDYAIRGVPMDLYGYEEKAFFHEILDELVGESVTGTPESIRIRIATMACKAAVKGNMRLSRQEAERLIDELLTLDNPYHCPHGRPTVISMSKYELEKKFKRIVN